MIPLCRDMGVGVIPWSPLARGKLTRDWDETTVRGQSDAVSKFLYDKTADHDRRIVEAVGAVAKARGVSRAQVAMAWLLQKPGITSPIVGATKPQHLADAVSALDLRLSPEEIAQLEAPYVPHAVTGLVFPTAPKYEVSVAADTARLD
jgi:aryl-alcohol dehydrogenase-like predicted oxidoreductase